MQPTTSNSFLAKKPKLYTTVESLPMCLSSDVSNQDRTMSSHRNDSKNPHLQVFLARKILCPNQLSYLDVELRRDRLPFKTLFLALPPGVGFGRSAIYWAPLVAICICTGFAPRLQQFKMFHYYKAHIKLLFIKYWADIFSLGHSNG